MPIFETVYGPCTPRADTFESTIICTYDICGCGFEETNHPGTFYGSQNFVAGFRIVYVFGDSELLEMP